MNRPTRPLAAPARLATGLLLALAAIAAPAPAPAVSTATGATAAIAAAPGASDATTEAAAPEAARPPVPGRAFALAWTEQAYLGRHRALRSAAATLHAGLAAFCARPAPAALPALQRQWSEAFLAWRRMDGAGAAPTVIARSGRMIDFRPARVRDVEQRIARGEGPAAHNVAVRGLGTLEYLLFGDRDGSAARLAEPARCAYAAGTAELIVRDLAQLERGWQQQLERLGGDTDLPRRNLLAENIGLMISGLDGALARFPKVREAAPEAWPDWRSASTRAAIGAQLEGFATAWAGAADGTRSAASLAAYLAGLGHGNAVARVDAALAAARAAWAALPAAVAAPAAEAGRARLTEAIGALKAAMEGEVAAPLGIVLGFNDNDGD